MLFNLRFQRTIAVPFTENKLACVLAFLAENMKDMDVRSFIKGSEAVKSRHHYSLIILQQSSSEIVLKTAFYNSYFLSKSWIMGTDHSSSTIFHFSTCISFYWTSYERTFVGAPPPLLPRVHSHRSVQSNPKIIKYLNTY
ncbi:hypothetical protein CIPAW_15G110100 [Carya illinoinensis]|uniref:Uncharacterized protein n=1 Tax=Carya illinoinensis TaxID=32201 RepID=A0A8T1NCD8_CARIL|nr:hypothetical protein CIPAW_15G110100 [Carya illinoinensis]